jgi:Cof subfamily protein (haloacid dehalogenase superfamily)
MSTSVHPEMIKALAMDLDGTILAPVAILTERTIRAINECMRRGLKVIIATGRAVGSSEPYRSSLNATGPMVYFNGALVAEMPGCRILKATLLDTKAADVCIDISREMETYFQLFFLSGSFSNPPSSGDGQEIRLTLFAEKNGEEREMYQRHTGVLSELADLKEALRRPEHGNCIKAMFLAEPEKQALLRPILEERLGGSVYMTQTLRNFLEIMNAGVSKGEGLKIAMDSLSLKPEEVIAFGDEENDLPMFGAAGFSAAPSSARDSVRAAADFIFGPCAEEGLAAFLEELFAARV